MIAPRTAPAAGPVPRKRKKAVSGRRYAAQVRALLPFERRAARTGPLLWGAAVGIVSCAVPAVFGLSLVPGAAAALLFLSAVVGAVGTVFALEDRAAPTTGLCPSPWWLRRSLRTASALLLLTVAWCAGAALVHQALPPAERPVFPYADAAVAALALSLLAMALALLTARFTQGRGNGAAAASAFALCVLVLLFLPSGIELFSSPEDLPRWEAAAARWDVFALLLAPVTALLHRQPPPREGGNGKRRGVSPALGRGPGARDLRRSQHDHQ
ncbi:hypothetical protein [Streptomyces clavuligerus]|uniref:Uncharacterized protein n=1 Tax=Streptomyces clavuligerus TaxID=1901 RepID=E2Q2Y6_STRCL|nr:hypothetical protein [Streptomyces clavuligerus]EFG06739.1 Hypothetical protein SCLAV_1664 [Streptomyces clavuligerus]MBY6304992.1 hypothetical protein [Streptomyces clavuligerus]QPJ92940.1 hypothetical protein GE265_07940 [Streptomyces clavuligerus]QPL64951.1 hypothetical protein I3J04_20200 [Streptomyces clavuligerus]QPL70982.1 hypothetical protein I3J05_20210 [Streptomyces clavuligerus]